MQSLIQMIPDADVLLALAPEQLAPYVLQYAKQRRQQAGFTCDALNSDLIGSSDPRTSSPKYPQQRWAEITLALNEAWAWLRLNLLILPAPDLNGRNGWMVLSRRAERIADDAEFQRFRDAAAFPKSMLHTIIADKVWLELLSGNLDTAVFIAFRAVEETVRDAGGFGQTDIGTELMRKAFHKTTGPLTDLSQPEAEREALAHLFAGSIGSYKNPHSHRTVSITDASEAQEMVMLASHLLRIVDSRRLRNLALE